MELVTSRSEPRRRLPVLSERAAGTPVLNDNCALRRNVAVQPYGRCSVCSLELKQCHAWQASWLSFALVVVVLAPLVIPVGWPTSLAALAALGLVVAQGMLNHHRTDELIRGQYDLSRASDRLRAQNREIEAARDGLEREVEARTTSLRDANVALASANLTLRELDRQRERMVLDVSHDLRTPLTSIKGAAQNLLDGIAGPLGSDPREYVEIVRDHADRLIGSVSALLEGARAEIDRPTLALSDEDLGALAADVGKSLAPIARERGVALEVDATRVDASVDRKKLRQVIENLVGNALKFTDRGGRVRVGVASQPERVVIEVVDTGVGIEAGQMRRLFGRFARATSDRPGSGLGLSIARDLVRLHGGDIQVESSLGKGSAFSVYLPRSAA